MFLKCCFNFVACIGKQAFCFQSIYTPKRVTYPGENKYLNQKEKCLNVKMLLFKKCKKTTTTEIKVNV